MSRITGEFIPSIQYGGARTNIINRRTVDELLDVGGAAPTNNQVLAWDALLGLYTPTNGGGVTSLYDLIEINITPPVNDGQVLTYTSGAWRALSPNFSFYALTQISITPSTLNTGDVLIFNASTGLWTGGPAPSGSISGLSDVFIDGPISAGQLLTYDDTISKWRPTDVSAGESGGLALQTLSTSSNVVVGNMYLVDITAATVNAALPIASNGARLAFKLIAGVAGGRVLNITTTETITTGSTSDTTLTLDTIEQMVELTYSAGVWRITGAIVRG